MDDSKTMLDVLEIHLTGRGYELLSLSSPHEALAEARRAVPDLIIIDVNMPGMTGLEFCRHLRAREETAHVPVIIVSSKLTLDVRTEATELGVSMCLSKPVRPNLLYAAVNRALAGL